MTEKVSDTSLFACAFRSRRLASAGEERKEGRRTKKLQDPETPSDSRNSQAILRSPRAVREVVDSASRSREGGRRWIGKEP